MLYYVFSGRVIQLLTVLEQMRAQMNRIEAKVNRTILGMYVPKNAVQRGLAFHAMTWKLRTGVVLCHVLSLTMLECL